MASDLLTTVRAELDARLGQLRPVQAEYDRLLAAVQALGPTGDDASASAGATKTPSSSASPTVRRRRSGRGSAGRVVQRSSSTTPRRAPSARKASGRAPQGAARQAILAALEHGSHTTAELVSVTAMAAPNIRGNLRHLLGEARIAKIDRDGKAAYALRST